GGLAGGAACLDPAAGADRAADDAGNPPLAKAAARGNGERRPAVDRGLRRLLLDAVLPDALARAGKRLDQLQGSGEADAELAGERGRFHFPAVVVAAAGEADAHLIAPQQRMLALRRRVFLIDELALPAAVRRSIGAEIVEEGVAAEDAAVAQQHHAGLAAGNPVQHPDVDRIKPADNAALADRTGR